MTDRDVALEVAGDAAALIRERFGTVVGTDFKGEVDPVTETDRAAEHLIRTKLAELRPDDAVLGEEEGGTSQGRTWIVDPLDGTINYLHGVPHFAVSVALYDTDRALVGVVIDVMRNEAFSAWAGGGADCDGVPIRVSDVASPRRALIGVGFPYDRQARAAEYGSVVSRILREFQGVRRAGSAALDLAYVAAGRFDGYVEASLQPWDVAAGSLLVTEAGGRITDPFGSLRPIQSTGPVIASNGALHGAIARAYVGT